CPPRATPCLWVFFGLRGQDSRRLRALQAGVLGKRGVGWGGHLRLLSRLLVVLLAGHGRPQRDDFVGVCVHQQEVLVRRRFRLAAVLLLVLRGVGRALATALGAVNGHIGGALERQAAGGDPARVALRFRSTVAHVGVQHPTQR